MFKIAQFTKYSSRAASARQRFSQYQPYLVELGLKSENFSFFDDEYVSNLFMGRKFLSGNVIKCYLRRFKDIFKSKSFDAIVVQCEVFPYLASFFDSLIRIYGAPIVFDYDDAIFHNYDMHRSFIVRALLARKIDRIMAYCDLVMAGNAYLADRARAAGARRVEIIPTVVDVDAYQVRSPAPEGGIVRIGWIGTPGTWTTYMASMMPLLTDIACAHGARIMAVGAGPAAKPHPMLDNLAWTEETEVAHIQQMDIGLMPLTDTPWSRGKCGYKLIQYMACGLPVIASPVGVNAKLVEHGVNGFLASTESQWRAALSMLLRDPALRQRMGAEGRRKVEGEYSLQVYGPRVAQLLLDVARKGRGSR